MAKKLFILIVVIFSSLEIFPANVSAIGMMTKPIVLENILRGQEMAVTLNLFNSEEKEVVFGLKADGQIANWASFYKIDDIKFEKPIIEINVPVKSFVDVKVKLKVPEDAPNGEYSGEVQVFLSSGAQVKTDESSVNVLQQIGRKVLIEITDKEIVQLKTSFIQNTYTVAQGRPLKVRVLYDNKGNVSLKPDLQFKITKDGKVIYNAIFPYPENEEAVRAFSVKEIPAIEWQTNGQENGDYKANLIVLSKGEEMQNETFSFSIVPWVGFLAALSFADGGDIPLGWVAIGGALLLLMAFSVEFLRKKGYNFQKINLLLNNFRKLF